MNKEFCLFQVDKKRAIWEVTKFCNYKCKHCCALAEKISTENELKYDDFARNLDEMKEYGIEEIYFSGGEPFSRKDILQILRKARENNINCNISTNGSLITENIAKELKNLNINKVHISLDHYIPEKFNYFRGGNYFDSTIRGIKLLKANDIYVRIGVVIWKENVDEIEEMIKYLTTLNVNEVCFNWLIIDYFRFSACLIVSTASRRSHVNSSFFASRPKCPYAAVGSYFTCFKSRLRMMA